MMGYTLSSHSRYPKSRGSQHSLASMKHTYGKYYCAGSAPVHNRDIPSYLSRRCIPGRDSRSNHGTHVHSRSNNDPCILASRKP